MRRKRVHPTPANPDNPISPPVEGNTQKCLRRLPHMFGNVLELPFQSDANVTIEEQPDHFRFVADVANLGSADIDNLGSGGVRAHAVEIVPGMIKIILVGNNDNVDDDREHGVPLYMDKLEMDAWRFRFPSATRPEMVAAEFVDGKLVVTVPKGWELEDEGDAWRNTRLVLVH